MSTAAQDHSLLSDKAILQHMEKGTVVISPFSLGSLNTSSYDVTLGEFYFREAEPQPGQGIYNPYSRANVDRVWGTVPLCAQPAGEWSAKTAIKLENIGDDDKIIWIRPGETILGHTNEFLGGRGSVTTMMKARSSMGRNFIEVCKCAGWGDVGYINRWTMEITNNSRNYSIPLVVGRRIAQIVFFDTMGTLGGRSYDADGKYQSGGELSELVARWTPLSCLPKMYCDREIGGPGAPLALPAATDDDAAAAADADAIVAAARGSAATAAAAAGAYARGGFAVAAAGAEPRGAAVVPAGVAVEAVEKAQWFVDGVAAAKALLCADAAAADHA